MDSGGDRIEEKREGDFEEGPIKVGKVGLMDGTPMSIKEALSHYEKKIKDEPKNPECLLGYANVLRSSKRAEEAVRYYIDLIRPLRMHTISILRGHSMGRGHREGSHLIWLIYRVVCP